MIDVKNKVSKRLLCLLISILLIFCTAVSASADENEAVLNPEAYPKFADTNYGALYAHATLGGNSAQAWQRWDNGYSGINAEENVRYFFLPNTADDSKVEIYNNYTDDAVVNGVTIPSYTSAAVNYTNGQKMNVTVDQKSYSLKVYKSDSEASVYVNDTKNSYTDVNGEVQNTDLYSFLIQNKENSVAGSDCAIAGGDSVQDTTLKKIKGRGNTNWRDTDKKPFNLNFNDKTTIGHTSSKKFSFVSNAKDSTLLRNSIMYDLANEVGSPYSPDQSFIDFFVNGVYRGSYIACQKIDLGKNSVVSLKDESDKKDTGFNFLVEVDVWNFANDVWFLSDKGYHVVLKTPDLDGYNENDESMNTQYNYIKNKYQEFENALYNGTLADLEKICDLDSLATQYLLQDFGKNCDGGYTSTYFTYNAEEGKFYAAPIWDCDSDLGAVDCKRDGCSESTCDIKGWVTRKATYTYNKRITTTNPLGQAFNLRGTDSNGNNFEQLCAQIWKDRFIPNINILLGKSAPSGRLKSIDQYASAISKASYNNYVMWDFMWLCSRYRSGLNKSYTSDYSGELSYLKDWTEARAGWMTSQFSNESPTNPYNPTVPDDSDKSYYLTGIGFGGWGAADAENKLYKTEDGSYIITKTFEADTRYSFKIIDESGNYYEADFDNSELISPVGNHNNAGITPDKDTKAVITFRNNTFTVTLYEEQPDIPGKNYTIYFKNTLNWDKVYFYVWTSKTPKAPWPGEPAQYVGKSADGSDIYKAVFEKNYANIIFNDGENYAQTDDIAIGDNNFLYYPTDIGTNYENKITYKFNSLKYADDSVIGDANCDGKINISDTTFIQKYLIQTAAMNDKQKIYADTNFDKNITIRDATLIQMYTAKIISSFS